VAELLVLYARRPAEGGGGELIFEEDGVFPIAGLEAVQGAVVNGVDVVPAGKGVGERRRG